MKKPVIALLAVGGVVILGALGRAAYVLSSVCSYPNFACLGLTEDASKKCSGKFDSPSQKTNRVPRYDSVYWRVENACSSPMDVRIRALGAGTLSGGYPEAVDIAGDIEIPKIRAVDGSVTEYATASGEPNPYDYQIQIRPNGTQDWEDTDPQLVIENVVAGPLAIFDGWILRLRTLIR